MKSAEYVVSALYVGEDSPLARIVSWKVLNRRGDAGHDECPRTRKLGMKGTLFLASVDPEKGLQQDAAWTPLLAE